MAHQRALLARLKKSRTAADEVQAFIDLLGCVNASRLPPEAMPWLRARFGVDGDSSVRLRHLAEALGISHEAVRQHQRSWVEWTARACGDYTFPQLRALEARLPKLAGCSVSEAEHRLRRWLGEIGLLHAMRLLQLIDGRRRLGWLADDRVIVPDQDVLAPHRHQRREALLVLRTARKLNYLNGAFQTTQLKRALRAQGIEMTCAALLDALVGVKGLIVLDDSGGWRAFLGESFPHNKAVTTLQVVGHALPIYSLHAAVVREARRARDAVHGVPAAVMPLDLFSAFVPAHPTFTVDREQVSLARPMSVGRGLSSVQRKLIELLRERGGMATTEDLKSTLATRGVAPTVTACAIHVAGYLESEARGLWKLRGADVVPAPTSAARGRRAAAT